MLRWGCLGVTERLPEGERVLESRREEHVHQDAETNSREVKQGGHSFSRHLHRRSGRSPSEMRGVRETVRVCDSSPFGPFEPTELLAVQRQHHVRENPEHEQLDPKQNRDAGDHGEDLV